MNNKKNNSNLKQILILVFFIIIIGIIGYISSNIDYTNDVSSSNIISADLENIPDYSGNPYIEINNNIPFFNESNSLLILISFLIICNIVPQKSPFFNIFGQKKTVSFETVSVFVFIKLFVILKLSFIKAFKRFDENSYWLGCPDYIHLC